MSDSYSAWCEEREENSRIFSLENIEAAKSSRKFASALKRASDYCCKAVLHEVKSCKNCMYKKWLNSEDICAKLGIKLDGLDDCVCRYWNGNSFIVGQRKPDFDVVAWLLIKRNGKKQS